MPTEDLPGRKAGTDHGTVVADDHSHGNSGRAHGLTLNSSVGPGAGFHPGSPGRAAPGGAEADGRSDGDISLNFHQFGHNRSLNRSAYPVNST